MSEYRPKDGCRTLWMKVTLDKYELPLMVADSAAELAKMCGTTVQSIYTNVSHARHYYRGHKRTSYVRIRVEIDDE